MRRVLSILLCLMLILSTCMGVFSADAKDGGVLKIGVTEEPDSLSPLVSYERFSFEIFMLMYDSLVTFDENMEAATSLAKSWEVSDDNLTWTFHLRDDVKWTDGEKFT